MILEANKVYKIEHKNINENGWRNYIICSPLVNVNTDFLPYISQAVGRYINFPCSFVICFDGHIMCNDIAARSAFFENNEILPLDGKDIMEVKKAISMLGVKYNRKLNKLVL